MKRAIVVGATSGIGKVLAIILPEKGFKDGITGRCYNLLEKRQKILPRFSRKHWT